MLRRLLLPWLTSGKLEAGGTADSCGMNGSAAHFAALWLALLGERARRMVCDGRLVQVAQAHAQYLHERTEDELQQSMHYGRGGTTPNQRVRAGGYALADWHGGGNTVECCVRCSNEPTQALEVLLNSSYHRPVLKGEGFWAASVVYGVGHEGADWVILCCPLE